MIFFPSFCRKSLFAAHALGPSWLTVFLLSSRLCFLASSYTIDASCRNYKGHDISGDMQQALNEVHEMAINAVARISRGDPSTIHLLESLYGRDPARHRTISGQLALIARRFPTSDFVVICNDLMVNIEPDPSTDPKPDPRGIWVDQVHGWDVPYDRYRPCDPLRKPGSAAGDNIVAAKTALDRYIYLCPYALDLPKGRSLAPYKDRVLAGKFLDDYVLTPTILFHEFLHTEPSLPVPRPVHEELREYPPVHLASDPASLKTRLNVEAYGFESCFMLAYESPDLALRNPDNAALCALGLYLHKCDWGFEGYWGRCARPQGGPKVRRDACEESSDLVRKSCEKYHVS